MDYEKLTRCLCCDSSSLVPYLDLGSQPLANAYHNGQKELPRYPLGVQVCEKCFHSQLTYKVDGRLMFDNYLYVTGTSQTLKEYLVMMVARIMANWKGKNPPRVLEIASNDGTVLDYFKRYGCEVVGVDPAKNLTTFCLNRGLEVYQNYWTMGTAATLGSKGKKFDIVLAVNVLPHVPDPRDFLKACKMVLDPKSEKDGGGIYIQTSQCDMFKNGEFDAIYHEHHSYFTVSSFATAAFESGLEIRAAKKEDIHSKSFFFKLGNLTDGGSCDSFYDMLEEENAGGWHTVGAYKDWGAEVYSRRDAFNSLLETYKGYGELVVGYGASAKANTVLNFFNLSLDYIVDDSEMKWGLLTPGRNISIIPPKTAFLKGTRVVWVMTAWNFKDEIIEKMQTIGDGGMGRSLYSWPEPVLSYSPEIKREFLHEIGRSET